ncbi:hypothetical protein CPC08DRAFT_552826 [Agrocybe pediades]|nr:hypothetical protein CPC08DRAFT_552826 [Agrocybe pediades]
MRSPQLPLHEFVHEVLTSQDQQHSSQATKFLKSHGQTLLEDIQLRVPSLVNDFAISTCRQLVSVESEDLVSTFQPRYGATIREMLESFSVKGFLQEAESIAPTATNILKQIGLGHLLEGQEPMFKDRDLIIATTLCMLIKSRNEHATSFQTPMAIYLLACGTSRSLFHVLNHSGFTISYTQAVLKLRQLGEERNSLSKETVRKNACMLIWDNLNIALKVAQQRDDSKDSYENGTTATLVPLFGAKQGDLPLSLKPPRRRRKPILDIKQTDLLPSSEEISRVQAAQLWHIMDILYDCFPDLRKRLGESILPPSTVKQIPVHKTEQYPLPTMPIDESSLEGTLQVLKSMIQVSLGLTDEDVRKHGIFLCAGDQLTLSLLDKVSAIRRDDSILLDNVGAYTVGQEGLLHVKFSHARMLANEYWGKPNGRAAWSLWKVNTLLGRKAISVGWKNKTPPPFRPVYELMLDLALPANILDGFRLYCGRDTIEAWVKEVKTVSEVEAVAKQVLNNLCSGARVEDMRYHKPRDRDPVFENICLFNRDALYLRQLKYAVKRGDVGAVLDLITHLMLAFRGTGKTPKYADTLFHIIVNLRSMDSKMREIWLNNWLANPTGKPNSFKEMDLLQEHLNFWLKIVYNAQGSNRSWDWLSMVSVSIFALRDVIRKVQKEFATPFNSSSHTNPSTSTDISNLCRYLKDEHIQSLTPRRSGNDDALLARDLIQEGAAYADKPSAFRNFRDTKYKVVNKGVPEDGVSSLDEDSAVDSDTDSESETIHPLRPHIDFDDLLLDDDEYPPEFNSRRQIDVVQEIVGEFESMDY